MIALLTELGLEGPYVGRVKYGTTSITPDADFIDLIHATLQYHPKYSGYFLAAYSFAFKPVTIFVSFVDLGVGWLQAPLAKSANKKCFVQPGNGIFERVLRSGRGIEVWRIGDKPTRLLASFPCGDFFAPKAAKILMVFCRIERLSLKEILNDLIGQMT